MIVDGNYLFLDFEKVKPYLINAFCKFYGEEYREEIKVKFDNVQYNGYHDYKQVVDYYNEYLEKFKDEISYEFFKVIKTPYNSRIADIIFPKDKPFLLNLISLACDGGENIDDRYSETIRQDISECREIVGKLFDLDINNLYSEIQNLKKSLNKAINNVELKHDCDVFRDVRSIMNTKRRVFKKFFTELEEIGVKVTVRDAMAVGNEHFDDSDVYSLDCFGIYFDGEFLNGAVIEEFTLDIDEETPIQDRFRYLYSKLKFLTYSNVELQFIDELDDIEVDYDGLRLLEKEYNYQKNHFVELKTIECVDIEEWKKSWKQGDFIPKHIAESIEYIRNECQDELYLKCKNFDFYKKNKFKFGIDFFTTFHFDKNDHMKPYYKVFINEGVANKEFTLSSLMHELNHVLGFYPTKMGSNVIECKEGLSMLSFEYLNKFEEEKERWDEEWEYIEDDYLDIFQENINERMAKEIYDIYIKMYENPYTNNKNQEISYSEYEFFDFITEEFYKANKKLLMKNVMEKSLTNLYYNSDGYYEKMGPIGTLSRKIKNNLYKRQDENRTKYSVEDLRKIGRVMGYFNKEILYFVGLKDITQEQIENGEYKQILSEEESDRLEALLKERDRLNKILVEEKKKSRKKEDFLQK